MIPGDVAEHQRLMQVLFQGIKDGRGPSYSLKTASSSARAREPVTTTPIRAILPARIAGKILSFVVEWGVTPTPIGRTCRRSCPR